MGSTLNGWSERNVDLRFVLGEFTLGTWRLRGLVQSQHFLRLTGLDANPPLPFSRFPPGIDVVKLPSHPITDRLRRWTVLPEAIRYVPDQYQRYYIELTGSFAGYLAKFSSKTRSSLRRKVRKWAELCQTQPCWRKYDKPEEMLEFHRLARGISATTYQEKLLDAGLPDTESYRCGLVELARRDLVRGYLLFHRDRAVAYLCCPVDDGNMMYEYVGYDPDYGRWSPGAVLLYLVLEQSFSEQRFRTFDFTEGEGQHKEFFASHDQFCADIYYFRRTLRHFALLGIHTSLVGTSRTLVRATASLGIKARLKKFFRGPAGRKSGNAPAPNEWT